jgi:hypothetical protein
MEAALAGRRVCNAGALTVAVKRLDAGEAAAVVELGSGGLRSG